MNIYANDFSLFDFDYTDSIIHPYSHRRVSASLDSGIVFHNYGYDYDEHTVHAKANYGRVSNNRAVRNRSPPKHRHDGTSPLPLGMDWSPPPLKREGQDSLRPDDSHKGWSYCVMIPSWVLLPKSIGSDPVVFYRVRVSIKSPEGVTTTRGILRRFNDFLKLFSELKKTFPVKDLPPAPSKRLLRIKSPTLLEERRCSLEDWMEKLLSDIDISRSVEIAMFLELEAAVRSSFEEVNQQSSDAKSSSNGAFQSFPLQASSDVSVIAGGSSVTSDHGDETSEISELGTPRQDGDFTDLGMDKSTSEQDLVDPNFGMFNGNFIRESLQRFSKHKMPTEIEGSSIARDRVREDTSDAKPLRLDGTEFFPELDYYKQEGHVRRVSTESLGSDLSSVRASEVFNSAVANVVGDGDVSGGSELPRNVDSFNKSDVEVPVHSLVAFASDERLKLNRVLISLQRRLATARTDAENLIARLNQEVAVRQFLSTKVRDLEVELETTRQNCKENMEQTVLTEKERFTQMQWDMEELRRKCLDLEVKLKSEQEEKEFAESTKISIIHENKKLLQELDLSREQLEKLQKHHEDLEVKSKTDVKMLVKEVKSLRNSHSELKQEFGQLMKEKLEVEKSLQKERQRAEKANAANVKLLHECGILCHRLQECSVNFLVEEEDKLIVDTSSPSDALDLLTTSDNRMGLLLAEAQLLAEDIEKSVEEVDESHKVIVNGGGGGDKRKADDELRKMVTDILVDNARLRKQVNSVIRCALSTYAKAERDEDDEDVPLRKTVLSKFLES